MASLREEARDILDCARAGIDWIAIWKTGRTWHTEIMLNTEYSEGNQRLGTKSQWIIGESDDQKLREIKAEDDNMILVNAYYCNLGPWEGMTLETLIDGIKFQYSFGGDDIFAILNEAITPEEYEKQAKRR